LKNGKGKMSKWKLQSLQFRQAIGSTKTETPSTSDNNFGYGAPNFRNDQRATEFEDPSIKQCPHCLRKFNEEAGTRHIPVCAKKALENAMKQKGKAATASGRQSSRQSSTAYGRSLSNFKK
jgi:hypothetical protein